MGQQVQIEARFRLLQVNRAQAYYKAPGSTEEAQLVESAQVVMTPVQGEPFGAYTPSGRMEMLIVNPSAARLFFDLPIGQEFQVMLSPILAEQPTENTAS